MTDQPRVLDPAALKALAHPLRVRLFDVLSVEGSQNSASLARRFGESTGATSYHLRQLARHGFIEEDPDRGRGRERWWRVRHRGYTIEGWRHLGDPRTREAARFLASEIHHDRWRRLQAYLDGIEALDPAWFDGVVESEYRMRLSPAGLRALTRDLTEVLERHHRQAVGEPEPGGRRVAVQLNAFPEAGERT